MRKTLVIEDVPELAIEVWPVVIGNFEQPIFGTKGIAIIYAEFMPGELWNPIVKILTIKQTNPLF